MPDTCNSVVFAQIPGHPDYFLGRIRGNPGSCLSTERQLWGIALFRMDWNTNTLIFRKEVFRPSTVVSAGVSAGATAVRVHHSFDPSVVSYKGELWVAFECATGHTSTCVGPLDWNTASIDPSRTTVVVQGNDADPRSGLLYSASVPNIFVFHNRLYVYWSAVRIRRAGRIWRQITIRGMQLAQEPSGRRRIWGAGSPGVPVASHDPARNVEVLGLNPADPYANQSADVKGVYADRNYVYLITSLGGTGPDGRATCLNPRGTSFGCYRMQIFRSPSPLGRDVFNPHPLVSPMLPLNPAAYQRPFTAPGGTLRILGMFYNAKAQYPQARNLMHFETSAGRLISYPFPLSRLRFR